MATNNPSALSIAEQHKLVDKLNKAAHKAINTSLQHAIDGAEEALQVAQSINYNKGKAQAFYTLAWAHFHQGETKKAFKVLDLSQLLYNIEKDYLAIARIYRTKGIYFYNRGKFKDAIQQLQQSLQLYQSEKDRAGEASAYHELGNAHNYSLDYAQAFRYYIKSLHIKKQLNDPLDTARTQSNIGTIYQRIKEFDKALIYYQQAHAQFKEHQMLKDMVIVQNNISTIYSEQGKHEVAIRCAKEALNVSESIDFHLFMPNICQSISGYWLKLNNFIKAVVYAQQCIDLSRNLKITRQRSYVRALYTMGECYEQNGIALKALEYYEESLTIAQKELLYDEEIVILKKIIAHLNSEPTNKDELSIYQKRLEEVQNKHQLTKTKQEILHLQTKQAIEKTEQELAK